jgi:hypothetical protein
MKYLAFFLMIAININSFSQSVKNDIAINELPGDVKNTLDEYVKILSESKNINECGDKFLEIAGGNLLNIDGTELYGDLKSFSLKRDFNDIKYYKIPAVITRISLETDTYFGFEKTLIEGDAYKIWIGKKPGVAGMPAPITIIKPKEGKPKVVVIGSL